MIEYEQIPKEIRDAIETITPMDYGNNEYKDHILYFQGYTRQDYLTIARGITSIEKVEKENLEIFGKSQKGKLVYYSWTDDPYGDREENVFYAIYEK